MNGRWRKMNTAPRDGTRILCTNGFDIRVCYPKIFPRPISQIENPNGKAENIKPKEGDVWEFFRDDLNAPGHTWSMVPIGWMPLPKLPKAQGAEGAIHEKRS